MLRAGRVVAAGPRATALTARTLGAAFGVPVRLTSAHGQLRLTLRPHRKGAFGR